jgi:uncharacterized protein (TIGR02246 family)
MQIVSAFLLLAVLAAPTLAQDTGTEEKALRELWSRFEEAYNQSDAARVASLYAPNGDRINGAFQLARGRVEVSKQYAADFARRRADATSQPIKADLRIRFLRSDVALLDGEWDDVRSGKNVRRYFTVILTRDAGHWQIAAGRVRGVEEL